MLKIAYHEIYLHPLPEGHRFPMIKYELIPRQLLREGIIASENLFEPAPAADETILLTHDAGYWSRMKSLELTASEMRKIGFPLSAQLVEREARIAQGTVDCALYAMKYGVSLNVAGGTHHAFTDKGEGFCLLNDFAVAANYLLQHKLAERILIIDLDVHQGNGTAQIFAGEPRVFTLSLHGKENYPFFKEKSDLDVELPNGIGDDDYLILMKQYIPQVIENFNPQIVFYLSGVDVLATDKYGKLKLSQEGCAQRDRLVFNWCRDKHIPVAVAMGGGYSPKISDIVNAHCNTYKAASAIFFT
jgi:acetoin utilization deacetylase AcuC-like enzyme